MNQSSNDRTGDFSKKLNFVPKVYMPFKLKQRIRDTNRKNEKRSNYTSNKASSIPRKGFPRTLWNLISVTIHKSYNKQYSNQP